MTADHDGKSALDDALPNERDKAIGRRGIAEARRVLREGKRSESPLKPIDPSEPREREEP